MTISLLWHRRVTAPKADPLRLSCWQVQRTTGWPSRRRGFEGFQASPRQVWPNRVRLRYGLEFLLRLLPTCPRGSCSYHFRILGGNITQTRTFTRLIKRHRRRTGVGLLARSPRNRGAVLLGRSPRISSATHARSRRLAALVFAALRLR